MHVLVIGGTRFVGYGLVWRLIAGGHVVTTLNRGLQLDPFGERIERLIADRTTDSFDEVLADRRFDAAVDFAAYTADDTRRVVSVLGKGKVGHYIFISSGQVYLVREKYQEPSKETDYQGTLLGEPSDEYDQKQWLYGIQKREAEDVLTLAWAKTGFPSTRLRLPMVNGERDPARRLESYLWRILDGGAVLLPDGGAYLTRHIYSGDVVRAIVGLLGNGAAFGEAYNLSQDRAPTLGEFVMLLARSVGAPPRLVPIPSKDLIEAGIEPVEISPFSTRWMSALDPSKARIDLRFKPESLTAYLDKITTSFLAHPPSEPPDNYKHRTTEMELAEAAAANRSDGLQGAPPQATFR